MNDNPNINLDRYVIALAEALEDCGGAATKKELMEVSGLTPSQVQRAYKHHSSAMVRLDVPPMFYDASIGKYIFVANPRQLLRVGLARLRYIATRQETQVVHRQQDAAELRKRTPTGYSKIEKNWVLSTHHERMADSALERASRTRSLIADIEAALASSEDESDPLFGQLVDRALEMIQENVRTLQALLAN